MTLLDPHLPRNKQRLDDILLRVTRVGRDLLTADVQGRLADPPEISIDWTKRVVRSFWGIHNFNPRTGEQRIRINCLLCCREVTDEVLEFLVWHELLHHVLLSQGHDPQFTTLELKWRSDSGREGAQINSDLATLDEHYQIDASAYPNAGP